MFEYQGKDDAGLAALFAALPAGAAARPESRVLDSVIGRWRTTTLWEPIPGAGVQQSHGRRGRVGVRRPWWRHGPRRRGVESARLLMAFDPTIGDYAAFTVHALSTFFEIERARTTPAPAPWRSTHRAGAGDRPGIHFRRTFHFQDPDTIDDPNTFRVVITYPDVPPGTYGGCARRTTA
jgi:hypothetical protein